MAVLLSIKPKYVNEIRKEKKRYEFRKSIFKRKGISVCYIYSTHPVKKVVGKFTIGKVIEDHPRNLWASLHIYAGINENDFFKYFGNREKGFAIEINESIFFDHPIDPYGLKPDFVPPQSFYYIEEALENLFSGPSEIP